MAHKIMKQRYMEWGRGVNRIYQMYIRPYKWEYLIGGFFTAILLFSTLYNDFLYTFRNGINFWYALSEGHPLSFYSYAKAIGGSTIYREWTCGAAYDFTIYLFFAVWNLPAWIYEKISGNYAETCLLCMIWAKFMYVPIAVGCARGIKKIYEFVTGDRTDSAAVVFSWLFSGFLLLGTYFIGQYDIIGVVFAIWGVYYFLKKDYKKFYIYFAVAITCKYFAVLIFVPLILLHEKRIFYIIRDFVIGFSMVAFEKVLFSFGKSYKQIHGLVQNTSKGTKQVVGVSLLSDRVNYLFYTKIDWGNSVVYLFFIGMALICLYCYVQKREENYSFYYKVVYITFAVYATFFLFTSTTVYWIILLQPWLLLMIYCQGNNRKINLLLEWGLVVTFIIMNMFTGPAFFNSAVMEGMTLFYLLGRPAFFPLGISTILQILQESRGSWTIIYNILLSGFVGFMIMLAILNWPRQANLQYVRETDEPGIRGVMIFRVLCFCGILMIPVVIYFCQVLLEDYIRNLQVQGDMLNRILQTLIAYDAGPK